MNRNEQAALIGFVIGDGCLRTRARYEKGREDQVQTILQISHSIKQLEYLQYKADRINGILGGRSKLTYYDVTLKGRDKPYRMVRLVKASKYFDLLKRWCYPFGKKLITPFLLEHCSKETLAYWFLDDGSTSWGDYEGIKKRGNSSSLCISKDLNEAQLVSTWLKARFNLDTKPYLNNTVYSLRFTVASTKLLHDMIEEFTPACMMYKVNVAYYFHEPQTPVEPGEDIV